MSHVYVSFHTLRGTKCQWAIVGSGEFKKLVYESTFTKRAEGMSFLNSLSGAS